MSILSRLKVLPAATLLAALPAAASPLMLEANKSAPIRLPGDAASIVIGNKNIADVAVHDERLIFVTGKTFGSTNLMVFDRAGRQIYSSEVVISTNISNMVSINRGGASFTYDCAPNCRSVLNTGDDATYFDTLIQQQLNLKGLSEE